MCGSRAHYPPPQQVSDTNAVPSRGTRAFAQGRRVALTVRTREVRETCDVDARGDDDLRVPSVVCGRGHPRAVDRANAHPRVSDRALCRIDARTNRTCCGHRMDDQGAGMGWRARRCRAARQQNGHGCCPGKIPNHHRWTLRPMASVPTGTAPSAAQRRYRMPHAARGVKRPVARRGSRANARPQSEDQTTGLAESRLGLRGGDAGRPLTMGAADGDLHESATASRLLSSIRSARAAALSALTPSAAVRLAVFPQ